MIVCVGLNHHLAPLEVRARCAASPDERDTVHADLAHQFGRAVLIATCGRFELYLDPKDGDVAPTLAVARTWLARRAHISSEALSPYVATLLGGDALRHMIRVACGLDSVVVGEDEILGQVRRGWLNAGRVGALSPGLDAAFRLAVGTGRQARRLDGRSGWTSLADAAASEVAGSIVSLPSPRVLIVGTGPMGSRAGRALRARFGDTLDLALAGRTPERVATRAAELGARSLDLTTIPAALTWADAAVIGLRVRTPLITSAGVSARVATRPLLLVDLSVPRAVDVGVADLDGVTLRDVDCLGLDGRGHGRWDAHGRAQVDALVEQAVLRHTERGERTDRADTLITLRLQAEAVRRTQLARTLQRLPHLDDKARWRLDALTRAIVNRLLHEPTMRLRDDTSGQVAAQVQTLFGLATES